MWIELHQELVEHRKLDRLMEESGEERPLVLGRLCILWLWAMDHRPDGDLSDLSPQRLGEIMRIRPRKAPQFCEALVRSGFLDRDGDRLRIHDWEDYNHALKDYRRKNAERQKRWRDKQRHPNVTVTGLPNQTVPNPTVPNRKLCADEAAPAQDAEAQENASMEDYLRQRGLRAEDWLGATPALLEQCDALTDSLFAAFAARRPTRADYAKTFPYVALSRRLPEGGLERHWDADAADLLRYAFEQAALAGQGGCWPYIEGVLLKLHRRGIRSLAAAEDYDWQRDEAR